MELFSTEEDLFSFLQTTDLFTSFDDFSSLKHSYQIISCQAGDILSLLPGIYVLMQGHLRLYNPASQPLKEVFPKDSIGEVDILTSSFPTVSLQAIKRSDLFFIPKETFFSLLEKHQILLQNTCRIIVRKLQDKNQEKRTFSKEKMLAIVPTSKNHKTSSCIPKILLEIKKRHNVSHYPPREFFEKETIRKDLFNDPNIILLECDSTPTLWTQFCLEEADRIWILLSPEEGPSLSKIETFIESKTLLAKKELFFLHSTTSFSIATRFWLKNRNFFSHFHVCLENPLDVQKIARIASCEAIGLVLSGGGAKGIAHIGILQAFLEEGIPIDFIGGSSMGSLIGALLAIGWKQK
ncbi:MAG: patatin-like phospholipase family protein, partial [Chlamydiota bacterium]